MEMLQLQTVHWARTLALPFNLRVRVPRKGVIVKEKNPRMAATISCGNSIIMMIAPRIGDILCDPQMNINGGRILETF